MWINYMLAYNSSDNVGATTCKRLRLGMHDNVEFWLIRDRMEDFLLRLPEELYQKPKCSVDIVRSGDFIEDFTWNIISQNEVLSINETTVRLQKDSQSHTIVRSTCRWTRTCFKHTAELHADALNENRKAANSGNTA
jgi:hypothetical protein